MGVDRRGFHTLVCIMPLMFAGSSVKMRPVANVRISTVRPGTASSHEDTRGNKLCLAFLYSEYNARSMAKEVRQIN